MGITINLPGNPALRAAEGVGQVMQAQEEAAFIEQARELELQKAAEQIDLLKVNIQKGQQEFALKADLAETQRQWQDAIRSGQGPIQADWYAPQEGIPGIEGMSVPPEGSPYWDLIALAPNDKAREEIRESFARTAKEQHLDAQFQAFIAEASELQLRLGGVGADTKEIDQLSKDLLAAIEAGTMSPADAWVKINEEFNEQEAIFYNRQEYLDVRPLIDASDLEPEEKEEQVKMLKGGHGKEVRRELAALEGPDSEAYKALKAQRDAYREELERLRNPQPEVAPAPAPAPEGPTAPATQMTGRMSELLEALADADGETLTREELEQAAAEAGVDISSAQAKKNLQAYLDAKPRRRMKIIKSLRSAEAYDASQP